MDEGERGGGGGVVTFVAMQLFHRFISSSNWMMEHTSRGGAENEQPKGRGKKREG